MTNQINHDSRGDQTPEPVRGDRLDAMLRAWHEDHREGARAKRDEILEHIAHATPATKVKSPSVLARIGFSRILSAAAVLAVSALLLVLFTSNTERVAFADGGLVQVAEGGALDALDKDGNTLGPCPLQHTDVKVEISGLFARTIVEQTYANPYPRTIEAVYTFPLSNHAAVDRMMMIVRSGETEKTIEGEVKERSIARAMYEDARESGYVASLLEQERPNIFTQSVANIEPGATVKVRIATIELARRKNGVAEYVFPMVVGPRYIPGHAASMPTLPDGWEVREGVVLRAPAGVEVAVETPFAAARLTQLLERAIPVRAPKNETIDQLLQLGEGVQFSAKYGNGSSERGVYFPARGLGELNGRFFYAPLGKDQGAGFAGDTNQVPDASRITPMPVKPSDRAGHDISVTVTIDSGGPAIRDIVSELHAVTRTRGSDSMETVTLDDKKTIPNRDFILHWKTADTAIEPAFFTHVVQSSNANADASVQGGYFALMLEPPARVVPAEIRPRELIFVLDVSGSMNGFPVEKSKALARKAIASMRAGDTFNFITFAGATSVLWPEPRAANEENRKLAEDFVNGAYGAGGTEMMAAINAALVQDGRSGILPAKLLDMPADGRTVRIAVAHNGFLRDVAGTTLDAGEGRTIPVELSIAMPANPKKLAIIVDGTWETRDGNRLFSAKSAKFEDADARTRFVFFLTDGYIGNDQAVVAAVGQNARASRVFSFGIGNSVNRFLLEEMARAGRGTCEIVTLADEADGVIERLTRRIESPVLTDIELDISANLGIHDLLPAGDHLPDLYDQEPIVLMGRFDHAASGSITVRGRTGAGAWERTISVVLPETQTEHDVVKTLWARAKVDALLLPKLAAVENQSLDAPTKRAVIRLGESYSIATAYTSFVAIEKSRVVVGGKPMLVAVPVELPDGTNWAGFFGEGVRPVDAIIAESRGRSSVELESLAKTASTRGLISAWTDFDGAQPNANEYFGAPAVSAPPLNSPVVTATMPAPASRPVPAAVSMPAIATSSEATTAGSGGKSDPQSTPPSGSVAKKQRELFEKKE
ncbi:MAG: VIT and VWA domain-containing protein, partial [Planctomycetota bacterium]